MVLHRRDRVILTISNNLTLALFLNLIATYIWNTLTIYQIHPLFTDYCYDHDEIIVIDLDDDV